MTPAQGNALQAATRPRPARGLILKAALSLLLTVATIAPLDGAAARGPSRSGVAAADGDGGSTIPIPPPKQPTPRTPTHTTPEATMPASGRATLDLAGTLAGSGISIETDGLGTQWLVFPTSLAWDQATTTFKDPDSGIAWRMTGDEGESLLTVPLASDRIPGALTVKLGPIQGNSQRPRSPVLGATLDGGPVEVAGSGARAGAVRLSAELRRLPSEVALLLQGVALDAALLSALDEAVGVLDMGIAAVAYAARVETDLGEEAASASIHMAVDKGWVEAWSADRIRIVGIGAGGKGSALETTPAGEDDRGQAWFSVDTPAGLFTFALVALGELTSGELESGPSWALWLGTGLGLTGLAGLAAGALLLVTSRRRRRGPPPQGAGE